jgi:hypothetical protein
MSLLTSYTRLAIQDTELIESQLLLQLVSHTDTRGPRPNDDDGDITIAYDTFLYNGLHGEIRQNRVPRGTGIMKSKCNHSKPGGQIVCLYRMLTQDDEGLDIGHVGFFW